MPPIMNNGYPKLEAPERPVALFRILQYFLENVSFIIITPISITMEEAKDIHTYLRKAAGIFHYVKVQYIK